LGCFEKAATLEKDDAELHAHIGDCHFELKHYDDAVTAYEKSYSVADKFKQKKYSHFRLAESQYLAGDFAGAKETLTKHATEFKNDYNAFSLMIQVHYALEETEEVKMLEVKMNDGKEKDQVFPAELRKMYCIDQFKTQSNAVKAYQAYKDQSYQAYPWRHKFIVFDADGKELFTVETQLDSSARNENTYTICKAQGDSLLKFENVIYDENFNYLAFREIVKKIISGESQAIEIVTGYNEWLKMKKAKLGGDGTSIETAIIIESIPAEYAYVRENYPGSSVMMQSLIFIDGIPYDVLRIKTEDGEVLDIYFNISSFFGKW